MPAPRLITGSPAALEGALAREVHDAQADDPLAPVVVLVGGVLQRPYLRRRLAEDGGWLGVEVVTPGELALSLGEPELRAAGRRPLGPLGERVLTEGVAARAGGRYARVADSAGFADALHRLARETRGAEVSPDDLAWAGAEHADLAALLRAREHRRAGFYDADDALAHADPTRLDASALLVHGLWEPSPALRGLLLRLAGRVPVVVLLPAAEDPAGAALEPFERWLAALGARPEPAGEDPRGPASGALGHLQVSLFGSAREGVEAGDRARIVSAPDPAREAREAARSCLRWAREGIAFHDIAIVYRQEQPYRALAEAALREAEIPVYVDRGTPLLERPLGRRAVALLELIGGRLERGAVMRFLADAVLPEAGEAPAGAGSGRWDALSRRAGIVAGAPQWAERLAALASAEVARPAEDDDEEATERRRRTLADIGALSEWVAELSRRLDDHPARATWSEHVAHLGALLETYVEGAVPLLGALEELGRLDEVDRAPVPFARFRAAVLDVIRTTRIADEDEPRPGAFGRRGVNVLSAASMRGLRFRALCALGLSDGDWPAAPRQDALLLDPERARLNERNGWELPLRALGPDPEPLGFHTVVHAASERLQLSFARTAADDNRPRLPSPFLRAAAETLTGERVVVDDFAAPARLLAEHVELRSAARVGARAPEDALHLVDYDRALLEHDPALGAALVTARAPNVRRARAAHRASWESDELTSYDGVLASSAGHPALADRGGLTGPLSPSALETYAECPYRFFLDRILALREQEDPEEIERLEPMERGTLVHRVLERFLSELGDGDPPRPQRRDAQLARLAAIADEECDDRERRGLTGYPLLWRFDRRRIHDDLRRWWELEATDPEAARLDRGAFELRFGPRRHHDADAGSPLSTDVPLELDVGGGMRLQFAGRIDRVNWREQPAAFRVIDYKTGRRRTHHAPDRMSGGRALQLPIYLLGAAHALGLPPEAGEAQYFHPTRRGDFERVPFSGAALRDRRDELDRVLRALAGGIAGGDFHLVPGKDNRNCTYCAFDALCPTARQEQMERKAQDPRAVAFAALEDVA